MQQLLQEMGRHALVHGYQALGERFPLFRKAMAGLGLVILGAIVVGLIVSAFS
jgi:hypothetical protein